MDLTDERLERLERGQVELYERVEALEVKLGSQSPGTVLTMDEVTELRRIFNQLEEAAQDSWRARTLAKWRKFVDEVIPPRRLTGEI